MKFYKLQASGNDFILIDRLTGAGHLDNFYKNFALKYCCRKLGIGADGLLVIEPSKIAPFKMRIFNSDGSEAQMCGNGARCAAYWASIKFNTKKTERICFETKAGIIEPQILGANPKGKKIKNWEQIRVKMTDPFNLELDFPINVFGKNIKVNFINSGVPHAVVFVQGLENIDVKNIGRAVRFHERFSPAGANVNFAEFKEDNFIKIRTYERGVEAETLACGTGAVASAVISWLKIHDSILEAKKTVELKVETKGREVLKVKFDIEEENINNVWLEGKAYLVYEGKIEGGAC